MFTKKKTEETTYTQAQYTALEERLSKLKEHNDTIDASYKQSVNDLMAAQAKIVYDLQARISELESQPHIQDSTLSDALHLHTFKRGGSVFSHGQDMELWECVDGCDQNPSAKCRILLPIGMVI